MRVFYCAPPYDLHVILIHSNAHEHIVESVRLNWKEARSSSLTWKLKTEMHRYTSLHAGSLFSCGVSRALHRAHVRGGWHHEIKVHLIKGERYLEVFPSHGENGSRYCILDLICNGNGKLWCYCRSETFILSLDQRWAYEIAVMASGGNNFDAIVPSSLARYWTLGHMIQPR